LSASSSSGAKTASQSSVERAGRALRRSSGRDGVACDHDRHDGGRPAGRHQAFELRGIEMGEIVDGEQGDGMAGERPDELAQLAVEPGQREIGNAITGTKAERVGHCCGAGASGN